MDAVSSDQPENGGHKIEVRDSTGSVLFTRKFDLTTASTVTTGPHIESLPFFSELVPVQPNASVIAILDPSDVDLHAISLVGDSPDQHRLAVHRREVRRRPSPNRMV